ncbi:MAG TPA: hypothetical protein VF751_11355 [Chthoniobacterales bacterium]
MSVWLGICLAEPMQLHLCVMHGGLAIESGAHSAHTAHSVSHAAHHSSQDHQKSSQCSCLGDCTAGSAPAFVAAARLAVALPAMDRAAASSTNTSALIIATDFVLPFSNGPPGTSSLAS